MAEEGGFGGIIHEWKTAKPGEKVIIGGAVLAVAGIAAYLYFKNKGGSTVNVNAPGADQASSGSPGGGQASGFPTVPAGSIPELPAGVNPIFDPNGNLIAFQAGGTTTPAPGTQPSPGATPAPGGPNILDTGTLPTGPTGIGPNYRLHPVKSRPQPSHTLRAYPGTKIKPPAQPPMKKPVTCPAGMTNINGRCVHVGPAKAPVSKPTKKEQAQGKNTQRAPH